MGQVQQEQRKFLEQQLQWTEVKIRILDEMDTKLNKHKGLWVYECVHQ